jgi:hypothetical protein
MNHEDYVLTFGKHRGKTFEWLLFHDPGYVWWLEEQFHDQPGIFPPLVRRQFKQLLLKASRLRVPGSCPYCGTAPIDRMVLQSDRDGRLIDVEFTCQACTPAPGPGVAVGRPGFRTPDLFHEYDKAGGKRLVGAIKQAYFGSPSFRMTDERIQAFFADAGHFADGDPTGV